MHPTSVLLAWLLSVVVVQFLDYPGLGLVAVGVLLTAPACRGAWWRYLSRARWLLATLWLILAYNTPGDALADLAWAPTDQGIAEATRHAVRLVVMLGLLAWLFTRLGRDGLVGALWGACLPLRRFGVDTAPFVVRLSLVLENLQTPHARGDWKKMLQTEMVGHEGPDSVSIDLPPWQAADSLLLIAIILFICGVVLL